MSLIEVDSILKLPREFWLFSDVESARFKFPDSDIFIYEIVRKKYTVRLVAVEVTDDERMA